MTKYQVHHFIVLHCCLRLPMLFVIVAHLFFDITCGLTVSAMSNRVAVAPKTRPISIPNPRVRPIHFPEKYYNRNIDGTFSLIAASAPPSSSYFPLASPLDDSWFGVRSFSLPAVPSPTKWQKYASKLTNCRRQRLTFKVLSSLGCMSPRASRKKFKRQSSSDVGVSDCHFDGTNTLKRNPSWAPSGLHSDSSSSSSDLEDGITLDGDGSRGDLTDRTIDSVEEFFESFPCGCARSRKRTKGVTSDDARYAYKQIELTPLERDESQNEFLFRQARSEVREKDDREIARRLQTMLDQEASEEILERKTQEKEDVEFAREIHQQEIDELPKPIPPIDLRNARQLDDAVQATAPPSHPHSFGSNAHQYSFLPTIGSLENLAMANELQSHETTSAVSAHEQDYMLEQIFQI